MIRAMPFGVAEPLVQRQRLGRLARPHGRRARGSCRAPRRPRARVRGPAQSSPASTTASSASERRTDDVVGTGGEHREPGQDPGRGGPEVSLRRARTRRSSLAPGMSPRRCRACHESRASVALTGAGRRERQPDLRQVDGLVVGEGVERPLRRLGRMHRLRPARVARLPQVVRERAPGRPSGPKGPARPACSRARSTQSSPAATTSVTMSWLVAQPCSPSRTSPVRNNRDSESSTAGSACPRRRWPASTTLASRASSDSSARSLRSPSGWAATRVAIARRCPSRARATARSVARRRRSTAIGPRPRTRSGPRAASARSTSATAIGVRSV